jgi:hypothetical protein
LTIDLDTGEMTMSLDGGSESSEKSSYLNLGRHLEGEIGQMDDSDGKSV